VTHKTAYLDEMCFGFNTRKNPYLSAIRCSN